MPRLLPLHSTSAVLVAALIAFGGALTPAPAAAAAADGAAATVTAQPRKHKAKKAAKARAPRQHVKFEKGSGETTAERDRRLLRECKGRPNAGACLGYAS